MHVIYIGLGTDETALISILAHRNVAQRKLVRMAYEELYQEDLIQQFKSELSGSFEVKTLQFIAIVLHICKMKLLPHFLSMLTLGWA